MHRKRVIQLQVLAINSGLKMVKTTKHGPFLQIYKEISMKKYYMIIPLILIVISCGKKIEKPRSDIENIIISKTSHITTIDKLKLIIQKALPNIDYTDTSLTCEASYNKELDQWEFTYDWHKPDCYFKVFIKNESAQYHEYQFGHFDLRHKYYLTDPVGVRRNPPN